MLNETTQLQIWDTAGEQQADLLDSLFWGNAAGAIIVCNLLQADCISALEFWQDRLHQARSKGLLKCLISLTFPSAETHHILHLRPAGTHASLHVSSQCLVKAAALFRHASIVACHLQESPSLPIVVVGVTHDHGGASAESGNLEARLASCMTYLFHCHLR